MGAYLSQPKTEKSSTDELNENLIVGSSSMQGWRNSQEDAHNAILNFDSNTSFFAVYDGHGGAEVAQYCADKLPDFLKELASYKNGNLEQALKDAFLGFDKTLLEPEVVSILKTLAGERNFVEENDSDAMEEEDSEEDLQELHEESRLPLHELMGKYKGHPDMPEIMMLKESAQQNSKPQSPFLRGRRAAAIAAESANKEVLDPDAKPQGSSTSAAAAAAATGQDNGPSSSKASASKTLESNEPEDDSTVSSSSSSNSKANNNLAANDGIEAEASAQKVNGSEVKPETTKSKDVEQNGSVTSSEAKTVKADVSTSSDGVVEKEKTIDDATVSGSNDAAELKQNGNGDISSTSKEAEKTKKATNEIEEDENDADYTATKSKDGKAADESLNSSDEESVYSGENDDEDDEEAEDDDEEEDEDEDGEEEEDLDDMEEADEDRFANDQFCANMIEEPGKDSGCTAVVSLLHGRDLYVANAGDSRCVVCRNGKAIDMSLDHKPEDEEESLRIIKAGGRVTLDGRVNGGLNLSRAIGDHAYKMNAELTAEEQMISALPDIKKLIITPEDEFMILACDGIWNYMSSDEVVEFVSERLKDETKKLSHICEELFDHCLAPNTMGDGTGCDNMTAVIIKFKPEVVKLDTKINAAETEDALLAIAAQKTLKRAASPASPEESANEVENASKRLKTDNVVVESEETAAQKTITTNSSNETAAAAASSSTNNESTESVVVSST